MSKAMRTADGYLVGEARVSRGGNVQPYMGSELGLTGDDAGKVFGVYRDPETVFSEDAMRTLAGRPVTRGHPDERVTSSNWKDVSVGTMGGVIKRDGEHVVASIAIMDEQAAAEIEGGARSLSAGYTVDVVPDQGVAEDGTPYQFRQAGNLKYNHVAYLPDNNPRAGNTRIADSIAVQWAPGPSTGAERPATEEGVAVTTVNIVLGDAAVTVPADAAPAIKAHLADIDKAHKAEIEKRDELLGSLKAEVASLKDQAMTPERMADAIAKRVELEAQASRIAKDVKPQGLTDAALRRAVVASKWGESEVKDSSDAEIAGAFRALARDSAADPVRDALRSTSNTAQIQSLSDWDKAFRAAGVQVKKGA